MRLQKKIAAGAEFIQTQPVLDMERFKMWLGEAAQRDITDKCFIIAGVIALKSVAMAQHLRSNVPGIMIPDIIMDRLGAVPEDKQLEEGVNICVECVEALKQIKGVKGIHIMAIGCEENIPEILEKAKLLPRPDLS
jgi:methylenetetrahydrofolate reductase (NADPH)